MQYSISVNRFNEHFLNYLQIIEQGVIYYYGWHKYWSTLGLWVRGKVEKYTTERETCLIKFNLYDNELDFKSFTFYEKNSDHH